MIHRPPLSAALASMRSGPGPADPRALIEAAAAAGFRWATLDGAAPGLRPRELDRSARRDLAALLRRLELGFAGIDLWIPSAHFADPSLSDRAVSAAIESLELAADIAALNGGHGVLSLVLPRELSPTARESLLTHADSRGVRIADHAWPPAEQPHSDWLGVGIDPAALLLAGEHPAKTVARLGERIVVARVSDASDISRVEPGRGQGRLDDLAYAVALAAAKYDRPVPLDLRAVPDPLSAAARVARWWDPGSLQR